MAAYPLLPWEEGKEGGGQGSFREPLLLPGSTSLLGYWCIQGTSKAGWGAGSRGRG